MVGWVRSNGAGDGQAEDGQQPSGRDQPGLPSPDDGAGEPPGPGQLIGPGPAQAERPARGDQIGDRRQGGDLGQGQGPRHHSARRLPGADQQPAGTPGPAMARAMTMIPLVPGVPGGGRRQWPAAPFRAGPDHGLAGRPGWPAARDRPHPRSTRPGPSSPAPGWAAVPAGLVPGTPGLTRGGERSVDHRRRWSPAASWAPGMTGSLACGHRREHREPIGRRYGG